MAKLEHILIPIGDQASLDELLQQVLDNLGLQDLPEDENDAEYAFCPTGPGGGIDPTCSPGEGQTRSERAQHSYIPATGAKQDIARKQERSMAAAIKGKDLPDNEPFDVVKGKHAIEIKTIIGGKNPKVTMHPDSLRRKVSYAKKNKMKSHTIVIDLRGSTAEYYYKSGVGSFRLTTMQQTTRAALSGLIK